MTIVSRKGASRSLDHVERFTCFVMVVAMALLVVGVNFQVVARYLLCYSPEWAGAVVQLLSWSQEAVQYAFVWMIYLGAGVGVRRGLHLRINLLDGLLSERGRRWMTILVDSACLVVAAVFVVAGSVVAWRTRLHVSPAMGLSMAWVYLVFPLSGAGLLVFLVEAIVRGRLPGGATDALGETEP
ncbi:MAG: TRAP transporter small permease [Pirellulales bacterium]|nr:TRAP transporter small permease [Pirellulales bacterium]